MALTLFKRARKCGIPES